MTIYIMSIGFDEKFQIRFLVRHGLRKGLDKVIIIHAPLNQDRAINAMNTVLSYLKNVLDEDDIITVEMKPIEDPWRNISRIRGVIAAIDDPEILADLTGGMRIIGFLTFIAFLLLPSRRITLEMDLESGEGFIKLPLDWLKHGRRSRWLEILRCVDLGLTSLKDIHKRLGISKATLSRDINHMMGIGLLEKGASSSDIVITPAGIFYLNIYSEAYGRDAVGP